MTNSSGSEGGVQPLQQAVGHRGAGEAQLADRAHPRAREGRMREQVVIERRRKIERGHALRLDQVERGARIEARLADEHSVHQRGRQQRAHAHGVVERHDAERDLARRIAVLRDMRDGGGPLRAVAARHALRPARRAGGVEHDRPVLRRGARGGRRALKQGVERGSRLDAADRLRAGRGGDGRGGFRAEDHRVGLGVREAVVDLFRLEPPVERHDELARKLAGPVEGRRVERVLEHGRNAPAFEAAGEPERPVEPGAVGQPVRAGDNGRPVRRALGGLQKGGADIKHRRRPVARLSEMISAVVARNR